MRRPTTAIPLAGGILALLGAVLALLPAGAGAALSYAPCLNAPSFTCTNLVVPLDRSGAVPGTITLSAARRLSSPSQSREAVLALAGGPGQAALPLSEFIAQAIAPALSSRDLLVFDQRGTGASSPLTCAAFEGLGSLPRLFEQCALQIGPARGDYTTGESVQDIEALRRAAGYEKLVLYGTSYGTKVALEYAERYPQSVSALVLDSVVATDGPDPLAIPTFQAIPGALAELCAARACAGITSDPLRDLARLAARLRRRALSGSVYDGSGHRHASSLSERGLLDILQAGDLNPALRALLPAAVQSALRNDPDPILRLHLLSEGLIPNIPGNGPERAPEVDEALFAATTCEEDPFPWQRSAPAAVRRVEALAYLHAQPPSAFYPFDASTAFGSSLLEPCAAWPDASPAPPPPGPLPAVPTLILSGAQDLRTPTGSARRLAAEIPGAQLLVVPFTGHSVLGSDLSGCAAQALSTFFAGGAVQPCTPTVDPFAPTPITPTRLSRIHPPRGLGGRPGQTLVAVLDTILDLNRQVIGATLQAASRLPNGSSFGGLHGGYARIGSSAVALHRLSFVPGIELTGTFPISGGRLLTATVRISGAAASRGSVTLSTAHHRVTGTLGGRRFDVSLATVHLSRVGADGWPERPPALPPLGRAGPLRLGRPG